MMPRSLRPSPPRSSSARGTAGGMVRSRSTWMIARGSHAPRSNDVAIRSTTSEWSPRPRSGGTVAHRRAAGLRGARSSSTCARSAPARLRRFRSGLEPHDALGDRAADRVRAAFVAESLLDQGIGRPVAAIALVHPGHRGDDHPHGSGGRHAPEQPLGGRWQQEEAGTRGAREQRERLALSLKGPLDRPRGHELGTWPRVHRSGSSQRRIRRPMGDFTHLAADYTESARRWR